MLAQLAHFECLAPKSQLLPLKAPSYITGLPILLAALLQQESSPPEPHMIVTVHALDHRHKTSQPSIQVMP